MQISLSTANILKTQFEEIINDNSLSELLLNCKLYEFEDLLHQCFSDLYDKVSEALLRLISTSPKFVEAQKNLAVKENLKKLEFRETNVRLRTGTKVTYFSLYAKVAPENYDKSRLLSSALWGVNKNCSPMYKSINCSYSVLCPSFDVSKELLNYQNIHANFEKVRQASLSLAEDCISERSTI